MLFQRSSVWVLHALLSHWWKHPVQLSTLMVGLVAATALWSGVQALNQQARMSYDQAAQRFNSLNQAQLTGINQQPIAQQDYVQLRRLGWPVTPLVEGQLTTDLSPQYSFTLVGIEPMTLLNTESAQAPATGLPTNLSLNQFLTPPWEVWLSARTKEAVLQAFEGVDTGFPLNPLGERPNLRVSNALADYEMMTDIYLAQYWLEMDQQHSRLLLLQDTFAQPLPNELSSRLRVIIPQSDHDISRLTESFHLNLTALSLLAYLVGLLMVYSAMHLAMNQRRSLYRVITACGIDQRHLMACVLTELLLLSALIALPGLLLGYWIASWLLPDLSTSLAGLYGAQVDANLSLTSRWWFQGLMMAWAGTLLASLLPLLRLLNNKPNNRPDANIIHFSGSVGSRLMTLALISATAALAVAYTGQSLLSGFLLLGLIFTTAALLLPLLVDKVLALGQALFSSALGQWLWADARLQISHLAIALIALLLALSTSIGVGGMVEGFRHTFVGWLDQRLAAEVYVRADSQQQADELYAWLDQHEQVKAILPSARADRVLHQTPIELRGIQVHATYVDHWPLLSRMDDAWSQIEDQGAVMINEQLARQLALNLGDSIPLSTDTSFSVVAIYSDYGNPKGQVMMSIETLYQHWPHAEQGSFALRVDPDQLDSLKDQLNEHFSLGDNQVLDQLAVKDFSIRLFERTFAATRALNLLVLGVASIALLSSLLTLSSLRLTQMAPVWASGVSRQQLMFFELMRLLFIALITAMLAIPLGLLISYCLVTVINVRAFGWALPWQIFPQQWFNLTLSALISALLAAIIPLLKLRFSSPGKLLKGFRDDQ